MSSAEISTTDEAIHFLGSKLKNSFDPQSDRALQMLHSLRGHCHGDNHHKVQRLLSLYDTGAGINIIKPNPFRELVFPDDNGWLEWIEKFESGHELELVKQFAQNYTVVLTNTLRGDSDNTESLLGQWADAIERLLKFEDRLGTAQRMQLQCWQKEAVTAQQYRKAQGLMAQLADLPAKLQAESGQWQGLFESANTLITIAPNDVQKQFGINAVTQLGEFADWLELLSKTTELLTCWVFTKPLFPWSSRGINTLLSRQSLKEVCGGITQWGIDSYESQWRQTLKLLIENALQHVLATERTLLGKLSILQQMRNAWLDCLEKMSDWTQWEKTLNELKSGLNIEVAQRLQELRDSYNNAADLSTALEVEYFGTVSEYTTIELDQFIREVEDLNDLKKCYHRWWYSGDSSVLKDNQLENAQGRLLSLGVVWGKSEGFAQLQNNLQHLKQELQTLDKAKQLIKQAEHQRALLKLSGLSSPAAKHLITNIEQVTLDINISDKLEQGLFDEISTEMLSQTSEAVRFDHQAYLQGNEFMLSLVNAIQVLYDTADIQAYVEKVVDLKSITPQSSEKLSRPAKIRLTELQQEIQSLLDLRLESEVNQLEQQVKVFPLTRSTVVSQQRKLCDDITQVIKMDEIDQQLQAMLLSQLEPIQLMLNIHECCHVEKWAEAEQLLKDNQKNSEQLLNNLQGTIAFSQLTTTKANDEQWLQLYRDHNALLLRDSSGKKHYLKLIRACAVQKIVLDDQQILQLECPEEPYLLSLCRCCLNPRAVDKITGKPNIRDSALLTRVLKSWCAIPEHFGYLNKLWASLSRETRQQGWSEALTPIEQLTGFIKARFEKLEELLADPQTNLLKLKGEMEALFETGQIEQQVMSKLDIAIKLEQRMVELNGADPWLSTKLPLLRQTDLDLDIFNVKIRRARGWEDAIKWRKNGILAWKIFEEHWGEFRTRFDSIDLYFPLNSDPWKPLIRQMELLVRELNEFDDKLYWGVAKATQSARWLALINEFNESPEGTLRLGRGIAVPVTPGEFREVYEQMLMQMSEFCGLHQNLLKSFLKHTDLDKSNLSREKKQWLLDLKNIQPLSNAVAKLKAQLTDPACCEIGIVYQQFINGGEGNE